MPEIGIEELYADRNRLVLLAACLATEAGHRVVHIDDAAEPEWPVLAIALADQGQVSWHVPRALLEELGLLDYWPRGTWDGHDNQAKANRIMAWCGVG